MRSHRSDEDFIRILSLAHAATVLIRLALGAAELDAPGWADEARLSWRVRVWLRGFASDEVAESLICVELRGVKELLACRVIWKAWIALGKSRSWYGTSGVRSARAKTSWPRAAG